MTLMLLRKDNVDRYDDGLEARQVATLGWRTLIIYLLYSSLRLRLPAHPFVCTSATPTAAAAPRARAP